MRRSMTSVSSCDDCQRQRAPAERSILAGMGLVGGGGARWDREWDTVEAWRVGVSRPEGAGDPGNDAWWVYGVCSLVVALLGHRVLQGARIMGKAPVSGEDADPLWLQALAWIVGCVLWLGELPVVKVPREIVTTSVFLARRLPFAHAQCTRTTQPAAAPLLHTCKRCRRPSARAQARARSLSQTYRHTYTARSSYTHTCRMHACMLTRIRTCMHTCNTCMHTYCTYACMRELAHCAQVALLRAIAAGAAGRARLAGCSVRATPAQPSRCVLAGAQGSGGRLAASRQSRNHVSSRRCLVLGRQNLFRQGAER